MIKPELDNLIIEFDLKHRAYFKSINALTLNFIDIRGDKVTFKAGVVPDERIWEEMKEVFKIDEINCTNTYPENELTRLNSFRRVYTKEEYINGASGGKQDIRSEIYDLEEFIKSDEFLVKPLQEKLNIKKKLNMLYKEEEGPKLVDDDTFYDISFENEEINYNTDGLRNDDDYNPKNWKGQND